jgi:uncharacterized protein YndB with AHSA1/START domain
MDIQTWDLRTGGSYRYQAVRDGEVVARFYGCFHEARPGERIVQTFGFEEEPDAVALEIMTFERLEGDRTRLVARSMALGFGRSRGISRILSSRCVRNAGCVTSLIGHAPRGRRSDREMM